MRKAPRTGPGPLCRAADGVGKFGGITRKSLPPQLYPWGGDGSVPISMGHFPTSLPSGAGWQRVGKMQEGTQRVFPGAGADSEQEEDSSKSWKGENGGGGRGDARTSQELSLLTARP